MVKVEFANNSGAGHAAVLLKSYANPAAKSYVFSDRQFRPVYYVSINKTSFVRPIYNQVYKHPALGRESLNSLNLNLVNPNY